MSRRWGGSGLRSTRTISPRRKQRKARRLGLRAFLFLSVGSDDGHGEAVVAFGADGLDGGGVELGVAAETLEEGAGADDAVVVAAVVDDLALADDVVGDDDGAGARELEGPVEVGGVVGLVGVEEDEVEGGGVLVV